jgi:uncharacterized protein (DUF1800 family)
MSVFRSGRLAARAAQACSVAVALCLTLALAGCGGGGGSGATPSSVPQVQYPGSDADARRFLTQATFGPTDADVALLTTQGFEPWIQQQIATQPAATHVALFDQRLATIRAASSTANASWQELNHGFWHRALSGPDQLRQRVAFALSQIFVVSSMADCVGGNPRGAAHYLDTLAQHAFGDFRTLLEAVSRHPIMGCYLSHLRNQRENAMTGRVPDENYAREVMQLFSIGLYQLRPDGTVIRDAEGNPIESYTADDVSGPAKVFTGFSYDCPDRPADSCFYSGVANNARYDDLWGRPMFGYPQFHSRSEKRFLGLLIPAAEYADPDTDLQKALDLLALTHPNVGPFIGTQLIQRLVTSNPSPAYVGRVTAAFEQSGRNLGAMVKAILTDPEARDIAAAMKSTTFGKVREPVLRLSAFLRAVGTVSDSGQYVIDSTDDVSQLSQSVLRASSVFNFYRPGYVYPGGASGALGLVAPELQIANESSAAGYVNFMRDVIANGLGRSQATTGVSRRDLRVAYSLDTRNDWYTLAQDKDAGPLIEHINRKLMYGTLPEALRTEMRTTLDTFPLSATPTEPQVRNRLQAALLMAVVSPEFLIQK